MMNLRRSPYAAAVLAIVLLSAAFGCAPATSPRSPDFAATIARDCAPWDGPAFNVSIPVDGGGVINVSVWSEPKLPRAASFAFPDATGRIGNATYLMQSGEFETLTGTASFTRVELGTPVEGEIHLRSDTGREFAGSFKAEWLDHTPMCG